MPSWRASDGRGNPPIAPRRRGNSGFRLPGIIKFLLFAGVLAGLVLIVLLTALRPVLRAGRHRGRLDSENVGRRRA